MAAAAAVASMQVSPGQDLSDDTSADTFPSNVGKAMKIVIVEASSDASGAAALSVAFVPGCSFARFGTHDGGQHSRSQMHRDHAMQTAVVLWQP